MNTTKFIGFDLKKHATDCPLAALNQLDENGKYPSERPKPENDRIRRYEALQNSLH